MENMSSKEKIKFWVDGDILYCKLVNVCDEKKFNINIDQQFQEALYSICDGRFLPLIIDLTALNYSDSLTVIKQLALSKTLKYISLSEAILVNTFFIKCGIAFYKHCYDFTLPFKTFLNMKQAEKYCNETNQVFNIILK